MHDKSPWDSLKGIGRALWNYSGTLAALALLIGVLAMMLLHMSSDRGRAEEFLYYRGLVDEPDQKMPVGIGHIHKREEANLGDHVRFEYSGGKLRRVVCADAQGVPLAVDSCGVAIQKLVYDEAGRLVRKENLDAADRLCNDCSGVAMREFQYDADGRLIGMKILNVRGELVAPPNLGYAEVRYSYDRGRLATTLFLNAKGLPGVNRLGQEELRCMYDEAGQLVAVKNYVAGHPANNVYGYAEKKLAYNERGYVASISFEDAEGRPALSRNPDEGCMVLGRSYDDAGRCVSERFYNEKGELCVSPVRNYAERVREYDAPGNLLSERYLNADGELAVCPQAGYAERVCRYDEGSRLVGEVFRDALGRPGKPEGSPAARACLAKRYVYDASGTRRRVVSVNGDGSKCLEILNR